MQVLTVLQGDGKAVTWSTSVSNVIAFAVLLAVGLPQTERHVAEWEAGPNGSHAPDGVDRPSDLP